MTRARLIVELAESPEYEHSREISNAGAFWVRAEHQTAGRGRRTRHWGDVAGGALLATLAIRRGGPADPGDSYPGTLALRAAAAVYRIVMRFGGDENVAIKWPNDILAGKRKVSGILVEADPRWFLVGIGINVLQAPDLNDGEAKPISLSECRRNGPAGVDRGLDPGLDPATVFPELVREMEVALAGTGWYGTVAAALAWRNRTVTVDTGTGSLQEGRIIGVSPDDGALLVSPPGRGDFTETEPSRIYSGTIRLKEAE